ncbi:MAG: phosphocholine cytidylyltransferase family protein [Flavobacteriaceae bacterium]|nr:phosphocholine cytidylyltransferase family protein [Flavobacteriaceae bacterium]
MITTALLLAAGTGSRLMPLTSNTPKCLTLVNEQSILERLVINIKKQGFKRLVVITGYQENCIKEFLTTISGNLTIEFVYSSLYKTTNNIYSLWMARDIIKEPFVLFEADLIFDVSLLDNMIYPDRMAISNILPWMNGTTVTIDPSLGVKSFHENTDKNNVDGVKYKTVNIYSFSLSSWRSIIKRLNQHIEVNNVNGYYETVIGELIADDQLSLEAVDFDNKYWYEVDTLEDLKEAEKLFVPDIYESIISERVVAG